MKKHILALIIISISISYTFAQQKWAKDGSALFQVEKGVLIKNTMPENQKSDILTTAQ